MATKKKNAIKKKKAVESNGYDNSQDFKSPYSDPKFQKYLDQIDVYRKNGESKVIALRNEIRDIVLNKQLDKETKKKLVDQNYAELKKAKEEAKINKGVVRELVLLAKTASRYEFKPYYSDVCHKVAKDKKEAREFYKMMRTNMAKHHKERLNKIKENKPTLDKKTYQINKKSEAVTYSAQINEAKQARDEAIDTAKKEKFNAFMEKYDYSAKVGLDKHSLNEWGLYKKENYIVNFNFNNWILKNALYFVIILVFVALVIVAGVGGNNLLSGDSILTALVQISPKIFFALGAGGLILLGGTDLSIGRLTGVGVSFTLMILSNDLYTDINGKSWWVLTGMHPVGKVFFALLISILLCTMFTTFAGFFTAKFKMHPFISTLSVQLISYGLFQIFWSATSSFVPDETIVESLRGPQSVLLVLYAIIAILIVWFIWNKTKFGKHLYAVGGNQEAATVSGINPFTVTLLAFIMAGILYGIGGFVQAIQTGTGNFNSGYGTETDAIAACVIGGISFSGGVGKVSGAVIGAIILGFLTHAFSYLGVNSNLQLLIKGVIILVAVALDCVKYLRKK